MKMKFNKKCLNKVVMVLVFGLLTGALTGCASIVSGHQQSVSVSTDPVKGAKCTLENNKGSWDVPSTPGNVTVKRSYENLNIECKKKGYGRAHKTVSSSTKAMAFGNILIPGLAVVGGAVDVASGAAYDYPQDIHLPIDKV